MSDVKNTRWVQSSTFEDDNSNDAICFIANMCDS